MKKKIEHFLTKALLNTLTHFLAFSLLFSKITQAKLENVHDKDKTFKFSSVSLDGHPRDLHLLRLSDQSPVTRDELASFYFSSNDDDAVFGGGNIEKHKSSRERKLTEGIRKRFVKYNKHPHALTSRLHRNKEESIKDPLRRMMGSYSEYVEGNNGSSNGTSEVLYSSSHFQPLRIHFETSELESWSKHEPSLARTISHLKSHILPGMAQLWSSAISVVPPAESIKIDWNWCPFADSDSSVVFSDAGVANTDIVVFVTANGSVCDETSQGSGVLASAANCYWDQYERPLAGYIDFCLNAIDPGGLYDGNVIKPDSDISLKENENADRRTNNLNSELSTNISLQMAIGTAVHEFAHILGVTSSDFLFFYDWETGLPRTPSPTRKTIACVNSESTQKNPRWRKTDLRWMPDESVLRSDISTKGILYYELTTPSVRIVAQNQFACDSLNGARLENQPTNGDCIGSHFEERLFMTENMSPVLGGVPEIFSPLTLALLHDSGWYFPNYHVAMVSPFGHGRGCDFVEKDCIVDGNVPEYGKGFFCNSKLSPNGIAGDQAFGCDPTHTHIALCDLIDYNDYPGFIPPGEKFQYFGEEGTTLGAIFHNADFCPTYSRGTISCSDFSVSKLPIGDQLVQQYESIGPFAKCFPTTSTRPICLEIKCDAAQRVAKVKVGDIEHECKYEGEQIQITGNDHAIICPELATICPDLLCPANCSGQGKCKWSSTSSAYCQCFDEGDGTSGCYESSHFISQLMNYKEAISSSLKSRNSLKKSVTVILFVSLIFLFA